MGKLYTSRIMPTTASATSAASGYPATNALLQSIGVPWRAANATQNDLIIDLGSAQTVAGIGLTDINALSPVIASSADNVTYTDRATPTFTADRFGRVRGVAPVASISARYWRIRFPAGTPTDGAAYFKAGAVYVFGAVATVLNPEYAMNVETQHAESRETLANGGIAIAAIGNRFDAVSGKLRLDASVSMGSILPGLRQGVVWLDLELSTRTWWSWPLINNAGADRESLENPAQANVDLNAREVVR